jgi:hypothetical protein
VFSIEVHGIEWDWFACDQVGQVALISSGGSGQVPRVLLAREAEIRALQDFLRLRNDADSWRLAAEHGFLGYDVDVRGGPFRRLTRPARARNLEDVLEPHRSLIARAKIRGLFSRLRKLDCALVSCAE